MKVVKTDRGSHETYHKYRADIIKAKGEPQSLLDLNIADFAFHSGYQMNYKSLPAIDL